ncbi:MAG: NAD-dependent epimerase/dehydratase family protein [archaeon]
MRVLITGAGGLIGHILLSSSSLFPDDEVIGADIVEIDGGMRLDVTDAAACADALKGVDRVIHLAGLLSVAQAIKDPGLYFSVNYSGTLNILDAMVKNKVGRIVFASSQAIYGNKKGEKEDAIADGDMTPVTAYGASKWMAEQAIRAYAETFGFSYAMLRPSHVFGGGQEKGIIPLLRGKVEEALAADGVVAIGNDVTRDFLHVRDLATAFALSANEKGNLVLNVGSGKEHSLSDTISLIAEAMGKKVSVRTDDALCRDETLERFGELAEITRIKELGWEPKVDIVAWLAKHIKKAN